MSRITPAEPPYAPQIAAELERIKPPGVPPLILFRALAKSPRVFAKVFAGGLLDKGPLSVRQREIVIDRTTARLGCEYEWGVHVAFFANGPASRPSTSPPPSPDAARAACWTPDEQALIALVDDLVDQRAIGDETWAALVAYFDAKQILEAIALVGYYHTISFLCRGLELPLETYAGRFPATGSLQSRSCRERAVIRDAVLAKARSSEVRWRHSANDSSETSMRRPARAVPEMSDRLYRRPSRPTACGRPALNDPIGGGRRHWPAQLKALSRMPVTVSVRRKGGASDCCRHQLVLLAGAPCTKSFAVDAACRSCSAGVVGQHLERVSFGRALRQRHQRGPNAVAVE